MSPISRFISIFILLATAYPGSVQAASLLKESTSPYLVMHADDAINWQPWSSDALEQAKREDKLIFLSIGYASCHWCHVMARTTFSDKTVISLLNKNFVNILVDSEERPDLYGYFSDILSAMGQPVGTPANFFLTADLTPLFGGGYRSLTRRPHKQSSRRCR